MEGLARLDGALQDVVEELRSDCSPGSVGVVIRLDDRPEEIRREGGVEPGDDGGVDLCPLGVGEHGAWIDRAVDVIHEPELAEGDGEEGTPDAEVGGAEVEDDGNMGLC